MKYKIKCLQKHDDFFPKKLEDLNHCPKAIYVIGNEKILNDFSIAMIGSRRCSDFGRFFARSLANELSGKNIIIVSGLAVGVDSASHKGCIDNKGKTIAVLGSGFNYVYPKENTSLIEEIIKNGGAIISEYAPDERALKKNFIERNKIIAALSDGIVLIEAKERSGSLSTINAGKKLKRKIFVVPGGVRDELYEGSNKVLNEGGYCIRNANDILRQYECLKKSIRTRKRKIINILPSLKAIYANIKYTPTSLKDILDNINDSTSETLSKLTLLEMQGFIMKMPGEKFIRL